MGALDGARAKQVRASALLAELEAAITDWVNSPEQPFGVSIPYRDPEDPRRWVCGAFVREEPPLSFGVLLGDIVHNARSALDHIAWQLVLANDSDPGRHTAWPFARDGKQWEKALKKQLRGASGEHAEIVRACQPLVALEQDLDPETTLPAHLQFLSNTDKHSVLHTVVGRLHDPANPPPCGDRLRFKVADGPGQIVREQFLADQAFEHRAELVQAFVEGGDSTTRVVTEGDLPIGISFSEKRLRREVVHSIDRWVRLVVDEFECRV